MFVEKISRNTGVSARFVGTVYDHVFVNKHTAIMMVYSMRRTL